MQRHQSSQDIAGWILLAIIVYAPWAYGCTRPWTIIGLDILMGVVALIWLIERLRERRIPHWPRIMLIATGWLIFQGWCMAANGHFVYDRNAQMFTRNPTALGFLPGAVDTVIVSHVMWRYTGLLVILLVSADLACRIQWRRRIMQTVGLTGLSIVLLGFAQKLSGAKNIFWEPGSPSRHFFGPYFYHGNAGAYLNLVLPVIFGQIITAVRQNAAGWKVIFWSVAGATVFTASFVNISKAGMAISILLTLLAGLSFYTINDVKKSIGRRKRFLFLSGGATVIVIGGISINSPLPKRWIELLEHFDSNYPRFRMAETGMRMVADAGAFGFGPGTFQFTFPHYETTSLFPGVWSFAHQDYLQTLIEWGWVGGAMWGILFFGGLFTGMRQFRRTKAAPMEDQIINIWATIAMLGIAMHSFADFPLQIASLQCYCAIYLGIGWSSFAWLKPQNKTAPQGALIVKH